MEAGIWPLDMQELMVTMGTRVDNIWGRALSVVIDSIYPSFA